MENKEPARPLQVRLGVSLLALSYVLGMAAALYTVPWHFLAANPPWLEFTAIILAVTIPVYAGVMLNIWKGSHQARVIYTVMVLSSMGYSIQMHLLYSYPALQNIFTVALHALQAGGIIFLFLPVSGRWFRSCGLARGLSDNRNYGF